MAILFSVCVWHAVVGSVIRKYTLTTAISTNSSITSSPVETASAMSQFDVSVSPSTGCQSSVAMTSGSSPTSDVAQMADYVALGVLLSLYILLHIVLALVILSNKVSTERLYYQGYGEVGPCSTTPDRRAYSTRVYGRICSSHSE